MRPLPFDFELWISMGQPQSSFIYSSTQCKATESVTAFLIEVGRLVWPQSSFMFHWLVTRDEEFKTFQDF